MDAMLIVVKNYILKSFFNSTAVIIVDALIFLLY